MSPRTEQTREWRRGYGAAYGGSPECPYLDAKLRAEWKAGWDAAKRQQKEDGKGGWGPTDG